MASNEKITWNTTQQEIFVRMCQQQYTRAEICSVLGISPNTLNRCLRERYGATYADAYKAIFRGRDPATYRPPQSRYRRIRNYQAEKLLHK